MDLLIITPEHIICIENKLKSSQHSNQLDKYEETLKTHFSNNSLKFFFLTLVGESSLGNKWNNISYRKLLDELLLNQQPQLSTFHHMLYNEYLVTLKNIVSTAEDFLKNPSNYDNVFLDGSKKKAHKIRSIDYSRKELVSANQLETIFQQLYLRTVLNEIGHERDYFITETRGKAILGITIQNSVWLKNRNGIEGFNFSMQFQDGGFKTFCAPLNYGQSIKEDMPEEVKIAFASVSRYYPDSGYIKNTNHGRTKAQCSVTKRIQGWGKFTIKEFSDIFLAELKISEKVVNEILIPQLSVQNFTNNFNQINNVHKFLPS